MPDILLELLVPGRDGTGACAHLAGLDRGVLLGYMREHLACPAAAASGDGQRRAPRVGQARGLQAVVVRQGVHDVGRAWLQPALLAGALVLVANPAWPRAAGDPVRLVWDEGDVAGVTSIYGPEGGDPIGFVEYRQTRRGDVLSCVRVARYRDGTSDEDEATARVSGTLEAVAGRSIIRDRDGEVAAEVTIDVDGGRLQGAWGRSPHTIQQSSVASRRSEVASRQSSVGSRQSLVGSRKSQSPVLSQRL